MSTDPLSRVVQQLDAVNLDRHTEAVDAARQTFEQELLTQAPRWAQRFTSEGQLAERERLATPMTTAEQRALDYAEEVLTLAQRAQALAESDDGLSSAERVQAAERSHFVREDCELLGPTTLAGRMRGALAAEDRVAGWLYLRYGQIRLQALADEREAAGEDVARRARARVAIDTLRPALEALAAQLTAPRVAEVRAKAAAIRRQAERLKAAALVRPSAVLERKRRSGIYNL